MTKLRIQLIVIIFTFVVGISAVAASFYFQKPESVHIILPNSEWEPIFFGRANFKGGINQATEMAGIQELRKTVLPEGEAEIRIWRPADDLEAIILKRSGGEWSALHLKADTNTDSFTKVDVKALNEPKSGWESFWKQMSDRNLFELPDASEIDCLVYRYDGSGYIVEINRNRTYRTYFYQSGVEKCAEAKQMDKIGEIIGLEFDTGLEQCKTTEWFACMTYRRKLEQENK